MAFRALACAEFPNDNPALHEGAIWYCPELVGPPVLERAPEPAGPPPLTETLPLDAPVMKATAEAIVEPPTDPAPPVLEADDGDDDIEIVDDLPIVDAVDEAVDPFETFVVVVEGVARGAGAGIEAMTLLGAILGRFRVGASATDADRFLRAQALAWQAILRGESEDFASCGGGMLDEWTASLVSHVLGAATGIAGRTDGLKRELRSRGVAAFGLVEQAA